jgi:hypothetical protein
MTIEDILKAIKEQEGYIDVQKNSVETFKNGISALKVVEKNAVKTADLKGEARAAVLINESRAAIKVHNQNIKKAEKQIRDLKKLLTKENKKRNNK